MDYLINETHFTIEEIASNATAAFCINPDELKARLNELHSIGLIPRNLHTICVSRKRYLAKVAKYCKKRESPEIVEKFKLIEKRIKAN